MVVLDGLSAVAVTEARLSEIAALGASYPAAAGARVWSREQAACDVNRLGEALSSVEADSPRGALAAALGMSMSGQRAAVFSSGPDLAAAPDLLAQAAGQHLPMVIHLASRAPAGHAQALGSGHEAYHAAADWGFFQLFAINVQEAVDLALIARRATERGLVPGLVAMDAEQTALAAQDVRLPDDELVRTYIGEPSAAIEAPTDAQRLIFGPTRRLVPRLYDLERPMMLWPLVGPECWALGAAGRRPYFDDQLAGFLAEAFEEFGARTGRRYDTTFEHRLDDAEIVLVGQGSVLETAAAVADLAARDEGLKVGVLGVRCLRPLPAAAIARGLKGARVAAVLERVDTPLAGDGPLLREVRAALDRARENARFGETTHPGCPAIGDRDLPRLVDVPFGLGGLPVRCADLLALVRELKTPARSRVYLGLDFTRAGSAYPKYQALMDALRRSNPNLETLGLTSSDPPPEIRPQGAITIAVHRRAGREHETLAGDAAALIHEAVGGYVRSRPALTWQRFEEPCADHLTHAPEPLLDPGDDVRVDIVITPLQQTDRLIGLTNRMARDGALLLVGHAGDDASPSLPDSVRRDLQSEDRALYLASPEGGDEAVAEPWRRTEALLGGLLALFLARAHAAAWPTAKVRSVREAVLEDLPAEERGRRVDAFAAAFESVRRVEVPPSAAAAFAAPPTEVRAPSAVRHLSRSDNTLYSLPRFWDQAGVFYQSGETAELAADPYLAFGAIPPLSATFRDVSGGRRVLPVFDPETCRGDRRLWTTCPDGSIAPLVISARALVDAGINLASARGRPADALRAVAGTLAARANKIVASRDDPPRTAAALLEEAFGAIMEKMDAAAERKAALAEALRAVVDQIGELPLARTPLFFDEPERKSPGSGELFTLAVNPDACKSPGLILARCEGRGLQSLEQTPETLQAARRLWNLWQELPDTSGATIERARQHPDVGPLAALLLSRHCLLAMAGGEGAEAGSGAKLALRQVLAVAEFHLQPRLQKHLKEIDGLRERLAARIREVLAEALPTHDLDALAEGLDLLGRADVNLATLSAKVDTAVTGGRIDAARLARLVEVARGLANLHWRLVQGPEGLGQARVGLTIAPGAVAAWAGAFPFNPFQGPVVIDAGGDTSQLARGLLEGQLRQVLAGFRLLRWARLELDHPQEAVRAAAALAALRVADLNDEERAVCPPMLVVGDGQALGGRGLAQLVGLLDSSLPVKVIVLSEIGGGADGGLSVDSLGSFPAGQRFDLALLALLARRAYVVQTSIADGDHFARGVLAALAFDGPALVCIHAPSPERHGFAQEHLFEQARLAVRSRAFPQLTFDPAAGGVFGVCLDLSGNPDLTSVWSTDDDGRPLTPVDWAVTEARFAPNLRPLAADDPAPTPLAELLDLDPAARAGKTAYVSVGTGEKEQRLRVGKALVADAVERRRLWRTLQELAGVVTPFTRKVREAAERDVAAAHDAQITRLKQEHEARIAQLRSEFEQEATRRVAGGLQVLAGYGAGHPGKDDAP
jgi:pyruvate-ferredoxin/flavodoxin oxidoreductase